MARTQVFKPVDEPGADRGAEFRRYRVFGVVQNAIKATDDIEEKSGK